MILAPILDDYWKSHLSKINLANCLIGLKLSRITDRPPASDLQRLTTSPTTVFLQNIQPSTIDHQPTNCCATNLPITNHQPNNPQTTDLLTTNNRFPNSKTTTLLAIWVIIEQYELLNNIYDYLTIQLMLSFSKKKYLKSILFF